MWAAGGVLTFAASKGTMPKVSELIERLRREHRALIAKMTEAREKDFQTQEGRAAMAAVRKLMAAHLATEDRDLYPLLWKAAREDRRLASLLEIFATEMDAVYQQAMEFFDALEQGRITPDTPRAFGALWARVQTRIQNEENFLYPEYERLTLRNGAQYQL